MPFDLLVNFSVLIGGACAIRDYFLGAPILESIRYLDILLSRPPSELVLQVQHRCPQLWHRYNTETILKSFQLVRLALIPGLYYLPDL